MNKIDLSRVDLNLLLAFEVLMRERSVTVAAQRMNRTQSAMSHALARLRAQLKDPLLIKMGSEMHPSPYALKLIEEVRPLLRGIERVLQPAEAFIPQTSTRHFCLTLPDFAPSLFPRIVKDVIHQAPYVSLEWQSLGEKALEKLRDGQSDLCLAAAHLRQIEGVSSKPVGQLEWACYVRQKHPLFQEGWGQEAWQGYPHLAVRIGDSTHNPIDSQSQAQGLQRRIAVWVPKFSAIAPLLSQTDLIATMPRILMQENLLLYHLVELPVPFEQEAMPQRLYWATRHDHDAANKWLREIVAAEITAIRNQLQPTFQGVSSPQI
jgi:DNA-binding transcriptional LysR family regulator